MTTTTLTTEDCLAVYKAVCELFGEEENSEYGPKLIMNWDWLEWGSPRPTIIWEEGPYEWAVYVPHGGRLEDTGHVLKDISSELPDGVWLEPATSWALSIYKD